MDFQVRKPPRRFTVGTGDLKFEISDCGTLRLEPDEQITFVTEDGAEYDLARKEWGFYATPSLNGRLLEFGFRGVLIRNRRTGRYFVLLVQSGREAAFERYCVQESLAIVSWLDRTETLDDMARVLGADDALAPAS
jgi:hypothetical protein